MSSIIDKLNFRKYLLQYQKSQFVLLVYTIQEVSLKFY